MLHEKRTERESVELGREDTKMMKRIGGKKISAVMEGRAGERK